MRLGIVNGVIMCIILKEEKLGTNIFRDMEKSLYPCNSSRTPDIREEVKTTAPHRDPFLGGGVPPN